ncbi:DUF6300 family protein [Streptomyces sp. NPDC055078]
MVRQRIERAPELPPCSRCGGQLTISAKGPVGSLGVPVRLELCRACDSGKPAAGPLLKFLASGSGKDPSRVQEGARLIWAWERETLAAHEYHWVPKTTPATTDVPPGRSMRPRGHG